MKQKTKLRIALGFFMILTLLSIAAYFLVLKPIRDKRRENPTSKKHTMKVKHRTKYNPDMIDSLVKENIEKFEKK